jgi:preprotein translocase subunit SecE
MLDSPARGNFEEGHKTMKDWIRKVRQFLSEVMVELKRTTWPSRKEVQGTTLVVIVTVIVFAVFLFAVDFVLSRGVTKIFEVFK